VEVIRGEKGQENRGDSAPVFPDDAYRLLLTYIIEKMIVRHFGAHADSIHHKLDLIIEDQRMLLEQLEGRREDLAQRIRNASKKKVRRHCK
jgi:hypothetical protein